MPQQTPNQEQTLEPAPRGKEKVFHTFPLLLENLEERDRRQPSKREGTVGNVAPDLNQEVVLAWSPQAACSDTLSGSAAAPGSPER